MVTVPDISKGRIISIVLPAKKWNQTEV